MRMAAYCRVSTDREEQLSSLENQREFFSQYAEKCGDTLVEIYADEGISGKSMKKRDAFTRLLADSEKDMFDYVAVKDISRFARNTSDFLYGIRTLRKNGVDVRFLSGNQTVLGESEFVLTVFAALAQEESANLSKRVIFGKKQNAKKGRVPNVIYGYDKIDTYTLKINQREGDIVRLMFRWYLEGTGTRRIAIRLNEMGIPTKHGAEWVSRTVRRILSNPIYKGTLINNKSVTKDFLSGTREDIPEEEWYVHDRPELRLVNDSDFKLVQKRLNERRGQYKASSGRYSSRHVFSNLIRCGECGAPFTARVYKQKNTRVIYRCSAHNNGGSARCGNSVTADEETLTSAAKRYILSVAEKDAGFEEKLKNICCAVREKDGEPELMEAKEKLLRRREKLKEMYVNSLIGLEEIKAEYARIDNGVKSIDSELASHEKAENEADIDLETMIERHEFSNEDMRKIIDSVVVYPDKTLPFAFRSRGC